jgi:superfamily I DNA and/or RNA helicase
MLLQAASQRPIPSTEAEFLLSRNRFNVTATCAERKLVVFCSDTVLNVITASPGFHGLQRNMAKFY